MRKMKTQEKEKSTHTETHNKEKTQHTETKNEKNQDMKK